jgi:hypothetical protein
MVAVAVYEDRADVSTATALGLAAAFLVAWLAVSAGDLRRVVPLIVRR